jgi:hypothetical protein
VRGEEGLEEKESKHGFSSQERVARHLLCYCLGGIDSLFVSL